MKKLGVTPQTVSTNPGKEISVFNDPTQEQLDVLQAYIDNGYTRFVGRVAKGRKLKESYIRNIAEGRVYDARQAMELKLVDKLGSLDDAVAYAAEKAGIKDDKYGVAIYPKYEPNVLDMIMTQGLSQLNQEISKIAEEDPKSILVNEASRVLQRNPYQARLTPLAIYLK